jgi:tetratricopeptide (TPR) repeat protein
MEDFLLQELNATRDPAEKAAIVAEYLFNDLPREAARVARQCSLFHWFNQAVVEALLEGTLLTKGDMRSVYEQLVSLPFTETLPWGLRFQDLTREGLIKRYVHIQPELLQSAARLAAPAYEGRQNDKKIAAESLFCYIVAGNQRSSMKLLHQLLEEAGSYEDWHFLGNLLQLVDEAERLPFVQPLPLTEDDWLLRGLVHRALGNLEASITDFSKAIAINPRNALSYLNRGTAYAEQQLYDDALADYQHTFELDPGNSYAQLNKSLIFNSLLESLREEESQAAHEELIHLNPNTQSTIPTLDDLDKRIEEIRRKVLETTTQDQLRIKRVVYKAGEFWQQTNTSLEPHHASSVEEEHIRHLANMWSLANWQLARDLGTYMDLVSWSEEEAWEIRLQTSLDLAFQTRIVGSGAIPLQHLANATGDVVYRTEMNETLHTDTVPDGVPMEVWHAAIQLAKTFNPKEPTNDQREPSRPNLLVLELKRIRYTKVGYRYGDQDYTFYSYDVKGHKKFYADRYPARWDRIESLVRFITADLMTPALDNSQPGTSGDQIRGYRVPMEKPPYSITEEDP